MLAPVYMYTYPVILNDRWTWADVKQSGPKADPDVWMVRDGKLYLFMYEVPKRKFLAGNVDARIQAGMAVRNHILLFVRCLFEVNF